MSITTRAAIAEATKTINRGNKKGQGKWPKRSDVDVEATAKGNSWKGISNDPKRIHDLIFLVEALEKICPFRLPFSASTASLLQTYLCSRLRDGCLPHVVGKIFNKLAEHSIPVFEIEPIEHEQMQCTGVNWENFLKRYPHANSTREMLSRTIELEKAAQAAKDTTPQPLGIKESTVILTELVKEMKESSVIDKLENFAPSNPSKPSSGEVLDGGVEQLFIKLKWFVQMSIQKEKLEHECEVLNQQLNELCEDFDDLPDEVKGIGKLAFDLFLAVGEGGNRAMGAELLKNIRGVLHTKAERQKIARDYMASQEDLEKSSEMSGETKSPKCDMGGTI